MDAAWAEHINLPQGDENESAREPTHRARSVSRSQSEPALGSLRELEGWLTKQGAYRLSPLHSNTPPPSNIIFNFLIILPFFFSTPTGSRLLRFALAHLERAVVSPLHRNGAAALLQAHARTLCNPSLLWCFRPVCLLQRKLGTGITAVVALGMHMSTFPQICPLLLFQFRLSLCGVCCTRTRNRSAPSRLRERGWPSTKASFGAEPMGTGLLTLMTAVL